MSTTTTPAVRRRKVIVSARETLTETFDLLRVGAKTINLYARDNFVVSAMELEVEAIEAKLYSNVEDYRAAIVAV